MIKLDDFDENLLTKEMQYLMKSITYIPWPKVESDEAEFWQKLKVTLAKKSSSYTNIVAYHCEVSYFCTRLQLKKYKNKYYDLKVKGCFHSVLFCV